MANFWFKFEWDAWLNDRRLSRCSFETQGFWLKSICLMEESGECFIDGTPDEVANLLGCSMEVLRRCVGELKRTGAAEVVAEKDYVKILSRRLLKRVNLREYNRLKQQEHRRQLSVNSLSIECQDPKSLRDLDSLSPNGDKGSPGGDASPAKGLPASDESKPARRKPAKDARKDHPAIVCVLRAAKRYPPKDLWDLIIEALGEKPDETFFAESYDAWRTFGGKPDNFDRWLFEPAKTGKIPERYVNASNKPNNGFSPKRTDADVIAESTAFYENYPS